MASVVPELFLGEGAEAWAWAKAAARIGCAPAELNLSGHPDLRVLSPQGMFIGIDQVREALLWARYGPVEAPHKVVLIGPTERLSHEAASSLLKSLEEVPPYLSFILFAASPDRLLPTVRSRCAVRWVEGPTVRAQGLREAGYDAEETEFLLWLSPETSDLEPFTSERRKPLMEWAQARAEVEGVPLAELAARFSAHVGDPIRRRATAWALIRSLPAAWADEVLEAAARLSEGGRESCLAFLWECLRFLLWEAPRAWPDLPTELTLSWARKVSLAQGEVEKNANLRLLMEVILLWPKRHRRPW